MVVSAGAQLRALITLRGQMVRSRSARAGFLVLSACVPLSLVAAASAGQFVPSERTFDLALLAPTVFLGFALLSLLSPLAAGGGQELYPPEQLVAYPMRARTQYLSGLAVLPLNLAWLVQLLAVCASAFLLLPLDRYLAAAALVLTAYVLAVTAVGQLVTWLVVGLRRTHRGRQVVWAVAVALAGVFIMALRLADPTTLLDASPTTDVVIAVITAGAAGSLGAADAFGAALPVTATCLGIAACGFLLGARACGWALRRPGDVGVFRESRVQHRRPDVRVGLTAIDRASVWRSAALRRGVLVLGLLPGGLAALLQIDWTTLVILPGLVAAGAGLLFGVNALCLDGSGAVWLASLPHEPSATIRAKTRVLTETCLGCVALAVVAAALRTERPPTLAEFSALLCAIVVATVSVVSLCLRWSTTRPHKAELRGPRDTPAPPGVMAAYSLRLAVSTTLLGLLVAGSSLVGVWWLPWALTTPTLLLAARQIAAAWNRWDQADLRARVVATVAYG